MLHQSGGCIPQYSKVFFFFFLYKVPGKAFQGVFLPSRSCEIMVTNRKEARLIKHRAEYGT